MKKIFYILALVLFSTTGFSQALPFDFEGGPGSVAFVDFDGGTATIEANPLSMGENTSSFVGKIVRNGGAVWAGSKVSLAAPLDFSENNSISMKVYTTAPVGTPVNFKLEQPGITQTEIAVPTTVSGEWETLTWDFSGQPAIFTDVVFMFDLGSTGDGSETSTFYFDDVAQFENESLIDQIDHPVDFEGNTTDYTVIDFGGNASQLLADPEDAGNMVIQSIKTDLAELWAGTTIGTDSGFATDLPFTADDTRMTVRVWSPTAGTPIRLKVENSADAGQTCETEAITTMAGAWEELEFDFAMEAAGTASLANGLGMGWIYNKASIFFNFGTTGADAGEQTYYFDDVAFVPGGGTGLDQIDHPVDFEGNTTDYTVIDFGGNASQLIADPEDAGNMVIQSVKTALAELWAGTTIGTDLGFATDLPFTMDDTKMTVKVWSPTAGTPIRLKVENSADAGQTCETETMTTMAGAWEVLEFDFASQVDGTQTLEFGITNSWVYDKASIFFNFGTTGADAGEQTYYFDDVEFGPLVIEPVLDQIDHPVDFEGNTTDYTVTDFGGNASQLAQDPDDVTNTVIQTIKTGTAELWAGTTVGTDLGFATLLPFTADETKMNVRVWSPSAGTPIRLKVEDANDGTHTCETEMMTTVAGAWEVLEFDFSNEVSGTPTLADGLGMGWVYGKASIFFNFGTTGTEAGEQTYYFDDVKFGAVDVSVYELNADDLHVYPNPTSDVLNISIENGQVEKIEVYDVSGKLIFTDKTIGNNQTISTLQWEAGVYSLVVTSNDELQTVRVIKK